MSDTKLEKILFDLSYEPASSPKAIMLLYKAIVMLADKVKALEEAK